MAGSSRQGKEHVHINKGAKFFLPDKLLLDLKEFPTARIYLSKICLLIMLQCSV